MEMNLENNMPCDWADLLEEEFTKKYWKNLNEFLKDEYLTKEIFPAWDKIFHAFFCTPVSKVRVVILGQDPYHNVNQANGLAFSVPFGEKNPPSLRNIYKELEDDLGITLSGSGDLTPWASQGVLLLNTVLTVVSHKANSHANKGWEIFTEAVISKINKLPRKLIFVFWGKSAQSKEKLIDVNKHFIIKSPHPSPLSAYRGFFGSKPFSKINEQLLEKINFKI